MKKLLRLPQRENVKIDEANDKIGGGGEGSVYKVKGHPDLVAKLFAQPEPRRAKVDAMLRNPPTDDLTRNHTSIAWPVGALVDAGSEQFAGYLMKGVEKASSLLEVFSPRDRMVRRPHFTFRHLLVVAWNATHAFSTLHAKGYVVGDVNESNILVNDQGLATLVDTDSFQVPREHGFGNFRCPVARPEFTPPELDGRNMKLVDRRVEHDLFGISVLLFQLLMQGRSPFAGNVSGAQSKSVSSSRAGGADRSYLFSRRRPAPADAPSIEALSPELEALFLRGFDAGLRDPSARPKTAEWMAALDAATKGLKTCSRSDQHVYGAHLKKCVWCEYRDRAGIDLFPQRKAAVVSPAPGQSQQILPTPPPPPPPRPLSRPCSSSCSPAWREG